MERFGSTRPLTGRDYVTGPVGVHDRFAALDSNFETAMRAVFGDQYADLEAEAREAVGEAKPLVARFVARLLTGQADEIASSWDALKPFAKIITDLPKRGVHSAENRSRWPVLIRVARRIRVGLRMAF